MRVHLSAEEPRRCDHRDAPSRLTVSDEVLLRRDRRAGRLQRAVHPVVVAGDRVEVRRSGCFEQRDADRIGAVLDHPDRHLQRRVQDRHLGVALPRLGRHQEVHLLRVDGEPRPHSAVAGGRVGGGLGLVQVPGLQLLEVPADVAGAGREEEEHDRLQRTEVTLVLALLRLRGLFGSLTSEQLLQGIGRAHRLAGLTRPRRAGQVVNRRSPHAFCIGTRRPALKRCGYSGGRGRSARMRTRSGSLGSWMARTM